MTSSPGLTSGLAPMTPGAIRFLLSWTNFTAEGSHTTYPFVAISAILMALWMRLMKTHPLPRSYLSDAMDLPSMIISSIWSREGALLSRTMCPSGMSEKPVPSPNCLSTTERMCSISCSKAGLTSPGGVISTSSVFAPQTGHSPDSRIGRLHSRHHLR